MIFKTLDLIGLAAFDQDLHAIDEPSNDAVTSLNYLGSLQSSLISSLPFYRYLPLKSNKTYQKSLSVTDKLAFDMISKRRLEPASGLSIFTSTVLQ